VLELASISAVYSTLLSTANFQLRTRALQSVTSSFIRFLAVGAAATALQYVILFAGVEFGAMSATVASSIGFAISAVFNYLANKHVTFGANTPDALAAPRFVAMVVLGLSVTWLCMHMLTTLGLHYLLSQVLTTGIVLMLNFQLASRWVFRRTIGR
jgi:putative flippase GtrA